MAPARNRHLFVGRHMARREVGRGMAPAPTRVAAARRRHLRAAGLYAGIALLAIVCSGLWAALSPRTHPDAVALGLGVVAYAMSALVLMRLIAAVLAWPR